MQDFAATQAVRDASALMIADDLHRQGWSVQRSYFDLSLARSLYTEVTLLQQRGTLRAAAIGKAASRQLRADIRGDQIHWLDGESTPQQGFMSLLASLRDALNRELFMSLVDTEAHFAVYQAGHGYARHLDSFHSANARRVSIVAYLNSGWRQSDGGQLQLFEGNRVAAEVEPHTGTLVCFISDAIYHAVVPTKRERFSVAAWLRVRTSSL